MQRDLEATAEGEAVDEAEGRLATVLQLAEDRVPELGDRAYGVGAAALDRWVRSAPAARMNGLPVTAMASIVSSASAASIAVLSASSEAGPKVLGLVVSPVSEGDQAD